uniref:Intraflagellar transport protein n=1 Tax=Steinernema glaseri TaxID=37863 RepID=A0A1I8A7F4_9BILA
MSDQLANLSLLAGGSDLVEAAKYYEDMPGYADKAVMLYHKAGMIGRALDLAFKTDQFSALDLIAKELDETSDPRVLERAAEFFANNQQYKKSAQLLAYAKSYAEAIELCRRTNVPLTEDFAETISPTKEAMPNTSERNKLLEKIAECCLQQSNYHYAAKKFAQAGNKIEAMRALIKSGDTPKIILFANTARNKDIYRLAGNYLQTINWKEDTSIMKHIETFYSKAGAYDSLAGFFESCAEVELEEYHDYEKTAIALAEAVRHLNRALDKNHDAYLSEKRNELDSRIRMIQDFLSIREIYENDPGEALRRLTALTEDPKAESFLRIGDVYAVIIIHNAKRGNYKRAHQMIEQFQQRLPRIDITEYIVPEVLDKICDEVKAPRVTRQNGGFQRDEDESEETVEYSHALRKQIEKHNFYETLDQ